MPDEDIYRWGLSGWRGQNQLLHPSPEPPRLQGPPHKVRNPPNRPVAVMATSRYAALAAVAALLLAAGPLGVLGEAADAGRYHDLVSLESARIAPLEAFTTCAPSHLLALQTLGPPDQPSIVSIEPWVSSSRRWSPATIARRTLRVPTKASHHTGFFSSVDVLYVFVHE